MSEADVKIYPASDMIKPDPTRVTSLAPKKPFETVPVTLTVTTAL